MEPFAHQSPRTTRLTSRSPIPASSVKSGTDVGHRDVRHLAKRRDRLGDRFVAGVVLNTGLTALSLGERLQALPISVLWDSGGS
jgi:uncharacterized protein